MARDARVQLHLARHARKKSKQIHDEHCQASVLRFGSLSKERHKAPAPCQAHLRASWWWLLGATATPDQYRPVFCFLFGLWAQPLLALWLCLRDRPLSPPTPQLSLNLHPLQSHGGLSLVTACVVTCVPCPHRRSLRRPWCGMSRH